jgi:hypothetical protein
MNKAVTLSLSKYGSIKVSPFDRVSMTVELFKTL